MIYPDGWPRCVFCDEPVLDGHLTCGRVECNEQAARALDQAKRAPGGRGEGRA